MIKEFSISTEKRYQLVNITDKIQEAVKESGVKEGLAFIFSLHTTAAILINEDEENLNQDWLTALDQLTKNVELLHNKLDNNADAHIKAGLIGSGKAIAIKNNDLVLGNYQSIFLAEFDGPRTRKVAVKII